MMKCGAPPDKFRALYRLLPIEFHGFTTRINSKGYHSFVPGLISIFLETVWLPLNYNKIVECILARVGSTLKR